MARLSRPRPRRAPLLPPLGIAAAIGLSACGATTSTTAFKGTQHSVAEAISALQSNATSGDAKKICEEVLAKPVAAKLGSNAEACASAVRGQLREITNFEMQISSVKVSGETAKAVVRSVHNGKARSETVALVHEGKRWKISGLG